MTGGLSKPRLARLRGAMQAHIDGGRMPGLVGLVSRGADTHVEALGTMAFGGAAPMARDTILGAACGVTHRPAGVIKPWMSSRFPRRGRPGPMNS